MTGHCSNCGYEDESYIEYDMTCPVCGEPLRILNESEDDDEYYQNRPD